MDLKKSIVGITLGIRYARSFRMLDISGDIVDDILYSDDSPFTQDIFNYVQEDNRRQKVLASETSDSYLRINTDDIILGKHISTDFESEFKWIKTNVLSYFKDTLFKRHKINNILRLGIIFHHKLNKNKKLSEVIANLTQDKIIDIKDLNISFSKKLSAAASVNKDVNDYKNTIYNLAESGRYLIANLDYQHYFDPPLEDLRDYDTDALCTSAYDFLENNFYKWLVEYENSEG